MIGDKTIELAKTKAPLTYEFYRGYFKGMLDIIFGGNLEDVNPNLDALIDHVIGAIICDTIKEIGGEKK